MNSSLQTYFFFWYPSRVLSPLNLLRMFASSLLILLISASLLLPGNIDILFKKEKRYFLQFIFKK